LFLTLLLACTLTKAPLPSFTQGVEEDHLRPLLVGVVEVAVVEVAVVVEEEEVDTLDLVRVVRLSRRMP